MKTAVKIREKILLCSTLLEQHKSDFFLNIFLLPFKLPDAAVICVFLER